MRSLTLAVILSLSLFVLAASGAQAASYQSINGTVTPAILYDFSGGPLHDYVGPNLEPGANLTNAYLAFADLAFADLSGANLTNANLASVELSGADLPNSDSTGANLVGAQLSGADFTHADLSGAILAGANISGAVFSDAILANAIGLGVSFGSAFYDAGTDFTGTGFDPVAAGWMLVAVPEPGTALLMGLGLAGLAAPGRR